MPSPQIYSNMCEFRYIYYRSNSKLTQSVTPKVKLSGGLLHDVVGRSVPLKPGRTKGPLRPNVVIINKHLLKLLDLSWGIGIGIQMPRTDP